MAQILLAADTLSVSMTDVEKLEALHGDVVVARSSVTKARVASDGMAELHGIRAPGTGLPGVIAVGTWRDQGSKTFAVCHGRRPAVVIELKGEAYDRLVVTLDDAEQIVAALA
ncbi:MAG TPA: hypothetical protein VIC82_14030 [Candidatus Nanopelagicales bacterium]